MVSKTWNIFHTLFKNENRDWEYISQITVSAVDILEASKGQENMQN